MQARRPPPYWRLSSFYLFYFASLGALLPYWALYLNSLGFDAKAIGELMAALMATKIVAPNLWGWIADHTGRHVPVVRTASLAAVIGFAGVLAGNGYAWLMAVMLVFSFFWNAALPQLEAATMTHLGDNTHRYSMVRLWGSIGFILTVAALGELLERFTPALIPRVTLALMAGIWFCSLLVPDARCSTSHAHDESIAKTMRRPRVAGLLAVCFLMQASHGPYYTFFTLYLHDHRYSSGTIGQLWAIGVIAEVGVFLVMHRLVPRFGLRGMLLASAALSGVRWLLIGLFVDVTIVVIIAQLLHAATFGVYHATAIQLIHAFFRGRHQGRGQALYSSMSFGAGGAVGSLYSGYAWQSLGPVWTYMIAAIIGFAALALAWRFVHGEPHAPVAGPRI